MVPLFIFRKKLKLRKNLKRSDWIPIGDHIEKRKEQGKKTELYFNGLRVKPTRVKKEVGRHRTRTDLAMRRWRLSTPPLPDGTDIRTPPASPLPASDARTKIDGPYAPLPQPPTHRSTVLQRREASESAIWAPMVATGDRSRGVLDQAMFGEDLGFGILSHFELRINSPFCKLVSLMQNLSELRFIHLTKAPSNAHSSYQALSESPVLPSVVSGHNSSLANFNLMYGNSSTRLHVPNTTSTYSQWDLNALPRSDLSQNDNPFEFLQRACFMLSNGHEFGDTKTLLDWIGISADLRILRAFFSLESHTVFAFWERLVVEVDLLRHVPAFNVLVEIGLQVYSKQGSKDHFGPCLFAAVWIGSEQAYDAARRLLEAGVSPNARTNRCAYPFLHPNAHTGGEINRHCQTPLHVAAHQLDSEMMKLLINFGALLDSETWGSLLRCRDMTMFGVSPLDYALMTSGPSQLQSVKLLLESGSKVNAVYPSKSCAHHNPCGYTKSDLSWHSPGKPLLTTDRLWLSQRRDYVQLYDLVAPYSQRLQNCVTVSGIISAAHKGVEVLKCYFDQRSNPQTVEQKLLLEIALSEASARKDMATILCLFEFDVDPNVQELSSLPHARDRFHNLPTSWDLRWEPRDWNPLFQAAKNLDVPMMLFLCEHGASINQLNLITALMQDWWPKRNNSAKEDSGSHNSDDDDKRVDRLAVIKFIMDNGFDIARYGTEAMIVTSQAPQLHPHSEVCDMLHAKGVGFDIRKDDKNLLQLSIRSSPDKIHFLLSRGLKVHSISSKTDGKTMLHDALECTSYPYPDRSRIVALLLKQGATCNVNGGGLTILESSLSISDLVLYSSHQTISNIRATAYPDIDDKRREVLDVFETLFRHGAPVNQPSRRSKNCTWGSILTFLIDMEASNDLIHAVLDAGANINPQGQAMTGSTPLQSAIRNGRLDLAYELINRGADINSWTQERGTALHEACSPKYGVQIPLHFIQFLIEGGADVHATRGKLNSSALHVSVFRGSLNVVCLLLDHGAEVNSLTTWNYKPATALDLAVKFRRLDMVQLLIDAGAESGKPGITRFDGAIAMARAWGHFAIVKLLEERASGLGGLGE